MLIHVFDGQEDFRKRWLPCPMHDQTAWCNKWGDRFASSMVAKGNAVLWEADNDAVAGLIFRPEWNRVLCSYAADGGTMSHTCSPSGVSESCVPGCWSGRAAWCDVTDARVGFQKCSGPFPPERLGVMLQMHSQPFAGAGHNEVIVDAAWYVAHLPQSLEAIIGDQKAHAAFLAEYGLSAEDVPLVRFTGSSFVRIQPKL